MTKATAKTLARHLEAINAGRVTKTNVIGIRKALNAAERRAHGYSVPSHAPTLAQVLPLCDALEALEPRVVDPDLIASGIALLTSRRNRKRLESVQTIIDNLDHFRLVRFDQFGPYARYAIPVYMAVSQGGRAFMFRNLPWQAAWVLGEESGPVIVATGLERTPA